MSASSVPKPSSRKIDSSRAAPCAASTRDAVGERERERERREERLAARQRASRAQLSPALRWSTTRKPPLAVDAQRVLPAGQRAEHLGCALGQRRQRLVEDPLLEMASVEMGGQPAGDVPSRLHRLELTSQLLGGGDLLTEARVVG